MDNTLTTFYIVRHGETDWNAKHLSQGQTDIPLNEKGEAQAKELAEELKSEHFDLAFSSDLMRAQRTAEIIALEHALEVKTSELLRERKMGKFEGLNYESFKEFDELFDKLTDEEKYTYKHTEDMESDEETINRLFLFFRETAVTHPGKNILVGTHSGTMRAMLIKLGYLTYETGRKVSITNAAYIILESDGVDFTVRDTRGIVEKRY